ncbi:MAG: LLM class flavin-dependent oxidoreductase, partial [Reyranella sp.]
MSRGRLDLGVGKGYRHNEFAGFAMPPEEAEPHYEEALDVLVRALGSNEPFSHRGRFFRVDEIVVEPPSHQRPHPPLWQAAGSAGSIASCARRGSNLLLDQFASPQQIGERIALYRHELEAAGHVFDPMRVAVARNVFVTEDASASPRPQCPHRVVAAEEVEEGAQSGAALGLQVGVAVDDQPGVVTCRLQQLAVCGEIGQSHVGQAA